MNSRNPRPLLERSSWASKQIACSLLCLAVLLAAAPRVDATVPAADADHDGMPDAFELQHGFDPVDPDEDSDGRIDGQNDRDQDGLGNGAEAAAGTHPLNPDTDGDGLLDGEEIGTGSFGDPVAITDSAYGVSEMVGADVDSDGHIDVLAAVTGGNRISWYRNNGTTPFSPGSWPETTIVTGNRPPGSVFAADVDGNGYIDALSGGVGATSTAMAWHLNPSPFPNPWSTFAIGESMGFARHSVFAADLNDDGDIDALAGFDSGGVAWSENPGGPLSITPWSDHLIAPALNIALSLTSWTVTSSRVPGDLPSRFLAVLFEAEGGELDPAVDPLIDQFS